MVTVVTGQGGGTTSDSGELLQQAQRLVPQVVSSSSRVKAFLVRWKMINDRLEKLPALLTELASSPCFAKNTLCKEVLDSLVGTLHESLELVNQCAGLEYGGGKLQMQSRLDCLANKLDGYLHDSRLMIDSGVLRQTVPLMTVSVTGVTKESRKWTVKDLLARLQVGSTESRTKALESLLEFMSEDDKNVLVVAASPGSIPALVHLLDSRVPVIREKSAGAVASLATVESCVHQIVTEGALPSLVRLLDPSRGSVASERAARALQSLTCMVDNARSVAAHGGVSPLLELCRSGTPVAQAASASVLRNLSVVEEIRRRIAEEDEAIQVLLYLLSSGTPQSREHAAVTLQNLASQDENTSKALLWNDGLEAVARFLDGADAPGSQEAGLGLLRCMATSEEGVQGIVDAGFVHQLSGFLTNGTLCVQQCAGAVLREIVSSTASKRVVGEAGCIAPLVRMLDAKTHSAQEQAVVVIANLLEVESNRKIFLVDDKGITGLVRLLDTASPNVAAEQSVVALSLLAGSSRNRKEMVACGACYHLGKLSEKDVSGSKKLLERLEGGKLKSLLRKLDIWYEPNLHSLSHGFLF